MSQVCFTPALLLEIVEFSQTPATYLPTDLRWGLGPWETSAVKPGIICEAYKNGIKAANSAGTWSPVGFPE